MAMASLFPPPTPNSPFFSLRTPPEPLQRTVRALTIPFPFHLNASCGPPIPPFHLSCRNNNSSNNNNNNNSNNNNVSSHALYLSLGPTDLRIISFLPSSLLLDYSPSSSSLSCGGDRWYSSITNRVFDRSDFFGVTDRNVLRLYDCEDSSVCEADGSCGSSECGGGHGGCCYALKEGSVWRSGDGFEVFSEFGCRGFSSWVVGLREGVERGIEMEWAVPKGEGNGTECAEGAVEVNATAVTGGVRCACGAGLVGDGFAGGLGCFKCEQLLYSHVIIFLFPLPYTIERGAQFLQFLSNA